MPYCQLAYRRGSGPILSIFGYTHGNGFGQPTKVRLFGSRPTDKMQIKILVIIFLITTLAGAVLGGEEGTGDAVSGVKTQTCSDKRNKTSCSICCTRVGRLSIWTSKPNTCSCFPSLPETEQLATGTSNV